ncbi:MAG TPA: TCR/Tet family MFS transporter [Candidatus Acidoferrum sp.]|jgi:DHA1 family tetracycline resistance protein-like MFS transporter|nr:TCR/Tet family MFS transporter [Candidatus Acidoferrum sp.]
MENKRNAALGFVFVTVLLDMLAFGIIVPILPKLISEFLHGNMALSSEYMGLFVTTWALMQFFFSPILGMLSDRYGRRPVILLSNFGLGLDYVVMALAPTIGWLFLGRILSGICSSSMPTATAYISDVTPPDKRAKAFGIFGAAFGVGFVLGPAIGGWLGAMNPRLPFWVAAGLSLLNAMYGFLVLPESLAPEKRQTEFRWKKANPVGALKLLRSHHELFGLAVVNFLAYLAHEVYATVWVLYAMYRYNWNEKQIGMSLAIVGITSMITMAGLVGPTVKRIGERKALFAGLFFGGLGFALFGWAPVGWIFFAAIPVNALWGLAGPPSQSMMTQRVSASEQGELQGAMSSMRGLAMIFGPGIFSATFAACIAQGRSFPAGPWYLAAFILLIALVVAWNVTTKSATTSNPQIAGPQAAS